MFPRWERFAPDQQNQRANDARDDNTPEPYCPTAELRRSKACHRQRKTESQRPQKDIEKTYPEWIRWIRSVIS
jgi:hypothetical protein